MLIVSVRPLGNFKFLFGSATAVTKNMKEIIKQTFLVIGVVVFADYVTADFDIDTGKNHFKGKIELRLFLFAFFFINIILQIH